MKTRLFIILLTFIFISCKRVIKEITETYPNGNPKKIEYFKQKDKSKEKIREEGYYPDNKIMYRGSFKENQASGKWKYWYNNGIIFSEKVVKNKISTGWKIFNKDGNTFMDNSYKINVVEEYTNGAPYHIIFTKKGRYICL